MVGWRRLGCRPTIPFVKSPKEGGTMDTTAIAFLVGFVLIFLSTLPDDEKLSRSFLTLGALAMLESILNKLFG
jgi:hypothetical protein